MGILLNAAQISSLPYVRLSLDALATSCPLPPMLRKYFEVLEMAIKITRMDWSNPDEIYKFNSKYQQKILELTSIGMNEESDLKTNIFQEWQSTLKKFRLENNIDEASKTELLDSKELKELSLNLHKFNKYIKDAVHEYKLSNDNFSKKDFKDFGASLFTIVVELFSYEDKTTRSDLISRLQQTGNVDEERTRSRSQSASSQKENDANPSPQSRRLARLQKYEQRIIQASAALSLDTTAPTSSESTLTPTSSQPHSAPA